VKIENRDGFHRFSPKLWRKTHNLTGDFVFDASIEHCQNKDMRAKLVDHLAMDSAYGPKTGYKGYSSMAGDD
jgi:hypothetical protein